MLAQSPVIGLVVASALAWPLHHDRPPLRAGTAQGPDRRQQCRRAAGCERAVVTTRVAEHAPGQVKVRDEVWRAVPAPGAGGPFDEGAVVTVEASTA